MPWAPKTPCAAPGCTELTHGRLCPRHEAERKARLDARRGSAAKRGYDARWRKIRQQVLNEEPLCRFCLEAGRVTSATDVDHIDGNPRNNDRSNLRPLCHECHSRRTARDQGFARKG